jgi:hypothetical protein
MTKNGKLGLLMAAGMLASSVAARAQNATIPDPNLAPSTVQDPSSLPGIAATGRQRAKVPDPDLAPSMSGAERKLRPSSPNAPELATEPDPDLAPSAVKAQPPASSANATQPSDPGVATTDDMTAK